MCNSPAFRYGCPRQPGSGCADAEVHQHDVRVREHLVNRMVHHTDLVCGLDYNSEGMLASGGNDDTVCIWETTTSQTPIHTFTEQLGSRDMQRGTLQSKSSG